MDLPVMPPVSPMLAKLVRDLPPAGGMLYEPKWDGFRGIVFRDGDEVVIGSRNERPLTRYFPELMEPLRAQLPERCVLDGEVVIATGSRLDFDALLQRIHPAESRVAKLARETPASFVAFDLLAVGGEDARPWPQRERRARLAAILDGVAPPVHLTPCTGDRATAAEWLDAFEGAGLDGVMAKPVELAYREGQRCMFKVKHERTADCVVAGFRWHKRAPTTRSLVASDEEEVREGGVVGSLLLGLYDTGGTLHHLGVTASFTMARRKELVEILAPYREAAVDGHPWGAWAAAVRDGGGDVAAEGQRRPGGQSRWNAGKDLGWEPLRCELVVEVRYDHLQGDRFRHATTFVRFRDDRAPASCTYSQLDEVTPAELTRIFGI